MIQPSLVFQDMQRSEEKE